MDINPKHKDRLIVQLSFDFSLRVIDYVELLEEKKKFVISRQLLKSASSIGANVREAQNAESKTDFIHKMKIALKEADETEYWILLCEHAKNYPKPVGFIEKLSSIRKVLNEIISSAKKSSVNLKSTIHQPLITQS